MEAEAANNVEKDSAGGGKNKRKRKSAANNTKEPPQVLLPIISLQFYRVAHQDCKKPPIDFVPTVLAAGWPLL